MSSPDRYLCVTLKPQVTQVYVLVTRSQELSPRFPTTFLEVSLGYTFAPFSLKEKVLAKSNEAKSVLITYITSMANTAWVPDICCQCRWFVEFC